MPYRPASVLTMMMMKLFMSCSVSSCCNTYYTKILLSIADESSTKRISILHILTAKQVKIILHLSSLNCDWPSLPISELYLRHKLAVWTCRR